MNQGNSSNKANNSGEIAIDDILAKIQSAIKYYRTKWPFILIICLIGALLGLAYSILKKPTYTAVCSFVLDDSKSGGGMGQYGGLAALAGINLGGGGGSTIFEGDNIMELYKSRTMIEKTLLNSCNFNGKKELLIDRFLYPPYLPGTSKDKELKYIDFNTNSDNFSRAQDSVITELTGIFNEKILTVEKPDKKLNIIAVKVVTKDELFSKFFTERLVQTVNDFYVQTKTKKAFQNVQILQRQADSVRAILNSSINGVASAIDAAPNANPEMSTLRVTSQKRQIDVQANTAIYSQMVQNLELAKISLRQEIPLIQIIDKPVLPLAKNKVKKITAIFIGIILGFVFAIAILSFKKILWRLFQKG